jgi:glycerol-3-phosphate acyltransferase PlsY
MVQAMSGVPSIVAGLFIFAAVILTDVVGFSAIAVALLVIMTHQKNIGRLLSGSESKVPIFKNRDKRRTKRG